MKSPFEELNVHAGRSAFASAAVGPDVPALRNASRFIQLSRRLGYPLEKIALVVNRANCHYAVHLPEIEQRLGLKAIATIPNAERAIHRRIAVLTWEVTPKLL